jgi:transposase
MKKGNKTYTNEFRKEAADLVIKQGYTISEAAKNLGINPRTLGYWVKRFDDKKLDKSSQYVRSELARLRKENKKLLLEREILKNAAAFFAREVG